MLTVIIPVHNGARFIREAIDSIDLGESVPVEVIVVDDASTDETVKILEEIQGYRKELRVARMACIAGPGPSRNHGLTLANGEIIGFLDADDRYASGALEDFYRRLMEDGNIDVVMGTTRALTCEETFDGDESFKLSGDRVRVYQLGSILVRRSVLDVVGKFDPAYRHGEDIDWFFRLQEAQVRFGLVDRLVLEHRRHSANMTKTEPEGVLDIAMVMGASLRRRKKIAAEGRATLEEIYYIRPDRIRMEGGA